MMDFDTNTWVTYRKDDEAATGTARISCGTETVEIIPLERCLPNNFVLCADFDAKDTVWVSTSKGLARGDGTGYYRGLRARAATMDAPRREVVADVDE
jgi:hypothetical protein